MFFDLGMAAAGVLAVTFAWAGAAKLGRPAETAAGFAELGLRRSYALARLVPFVELGLATPVDLLTGGADVITTGGGAAIVFGAIGADTITAAGGDNIVFGDFGVVDWVAAERGGTLPGDDTDAFDIDRVLSLAPAVEGAWKVPIVKTEASRGKGVETLVEKLDEHRAFIDAEGTLSERRGRNLRNEVLSICTFRMRRDLAARMDGDDELTALLAQVVERRLDPASAATQILARFEA